MRRLAIAAALLFSTSALAATPAQWKDIHALYAVYGSCGGYEGDDIELTKICTEEDRLVRKLTKQGFCLRGHIMVGRPSKDGKHCYEVHR